MFKTVTELIFGDIETSNDKMRYATWFGKRKVLKLRGEPRESLERVAGADAKLRDVTIERQQTKNGISIDVQLYHKGTPFYTGVANSIATLHIRQAKRVWGPRHSSLTPHPSR